MYEAAPSSGGKLRIKIPDGSEWASDDFHRRMNEIQKAISDGDSPPAVFVVSGDVVGYGHDGEPLLKHVQVLQEIQLTALEWRTS